MICDKSHKKPSPTDKPHESEESSPAIPEEFAYGLEHHVPSTIICINNALNELFLVTGWHWHWHWLALRSIALVNYGVITPLLFSTLTTLRPYTMSPSNALPGADQHPRDTDRFPNTDDASNTSQQTEFPSSNSNLKSPSKSLYRSVSASSASSSFANSSDRALNTIKHIAAGVKRKGRHLRLRSDSTPSQIPSFPLISPTGASPSSTTQAFHHPVIHQQHPQHLLVNSFSRQLAVSAPPRPSPKSPPYSSLQSLPSEEVTPLDSPVGRQHSFRHENYPRRPMLSSHDPISSSAPAPQPTSGIDFSVESDVKVPALLQQGTPMLKVSSKKIKSRMVRLDADLGQIQWQSKKSGVGKRTLPLPLLTVPVII